MIARNELTDVQVQTGNPSDTIETKSPVPLRRRGVVERFVDGELVLYDDERRRVHVLNATAAFVWRLCDGEHLPTHIVAALGEHFPENLGDIVVDVSEILDRFCIEGLLER